MRVCVLAVVASLGLLTGDGTLAQQESAGERDFRTQVVPIFEKHCLHCHGGEQPKAGLSLGKRNSALGGGDNGPALVPGKPEDSLLLKMISGAKPRMPLKEAPLAAAEVAAIRQWIADGAKWPDE